MSVVLNMDPVISSLVADPVTVLPQGKSTITCVAIDPDGDVLNYSWKPSDGSITKSGNTVTWIAPDREGDFTITVIVDDGKGGQNVDDVSVSVVLTEKTETFTPVPNETGTVSSTGRHYTFTKAGDDANNIGYRAFWSFDLYSLRGTEVKDAKLTFTTKKVVSDPSPFAKGHEGLRGLHLWQIRDDTVGDLPGYYSDWERELAPIMWEPPEVIDVTEEVSRIGKGLSPRRLQLRADFTSKTNGNCIEQYIEWHSVTLTVTYAEK